VGHERRTLDHPSVVGAFFSVTGFGKVLCYKPALWNQALHEVPRFSAVPQDLFIFIGVCEFLGGVGQQARVERRRLQISFRSLTSPVSNWRPQTSALIEIQPALPFPAFFLPRIPLEKPTATKTATKRFWPLRI
jgi:hypothetical protein